MIYILMLISYLIGVKITYNIDLETLNGDKRYYFQKLYFFTPSFFRSVLTLLPFYLLITIDIPGYIALAVILFNEGLDYLRLKKEGSIFFIEILQITSMFGMCYLWR